MGRALILLSNDDGVRSDGLACLREALLEIADVVVVAPEQEQSASSHALSLHRPLRFTEHDSNVFSLQGTPADCVYTALFGGTRFVPRTPDIVVAGMNRGLNLAADVHYSGTVAAAREAALRGLRAIAFSADVDANLRDTCRLARRLVAAVIEERDPTAMLLNVNFPRGAEWPFVLTRLGSRIYRDGVDFRQDPRGGEYLWLGGPPGAEHSADADTDTGAYDRGWVGVTPLELDPSSREHRGRALAILESLVEMGG
jgi:5'-nucleotidase